MSKTKKLFIKKLLLTCNDLKILKALKRKIPKAFTRKKVVAVGTEEETALYSQLIRKMRAIEESECLQYPDRT